MRLNETYEKYHDKVQFYSVYIAEEHPNDGWQVKENLRDGIIFDQATTMEERAETAEACVVGLKLKLPMLLADMENDTGLSYAARPVRLFVIGSDGVLVHRSGIGPGDLDIEGAVNAIAELAAAS